MEASLRVEAQRVHGDEPAPLDPCAFFLMIDVPPAPCVVPDRAAVSGSEHPWAAVHDRIGRGPDERAHWVIGHGIAHGIIGCAGA